MLESKHMKINKLVLMNFRNHVAFEADLERTNIIVGPNTAGKTNVLEAIWLVSTGESFREGRVEEMVNFGAEVAHVGAKVSNGDGEEIELQVVITRGVVAGKRVNKRRFLVNGVGRNRSKFMENLFAVVFRPEDMRIVEGSPARRRQFLDEVLTQIDGEYGRSLKAYGNALRRRNKILEMIREGRTGRQALGYWDQSVIKNGTYVQEKRRAMVDYFNHTQTYKEFGLSASYEVSVMSERRLEEYKQKELAAGYTLVGPHRDDIEVKKVMKGKERSLMAFGSRGEQRLGVLWLKLLSMEFVEKMSGERPILLLDDIMSELDRGHRQLIWEQLERQQTIITTADNEQIPVWSKEMKVIEL